MSASPDRVRLVCDRVSRQLREDITTTGASTGVPTTGDPTTGEPETSAAPLTTTTDTTGTTEPPIECGNGVVEGDEACDDGNDDETDACLASCVVATTQPAPPT